MRTRVTVSTSVDTRALLGTVLITTMVGSSPHGTKTMTRGAATVHRYTKEAGGSKSNY